MGVALKIPHTKDDGELWLRVVVQMEFKNDGVALRIGKNRKFQVFRLVWDREAIARFRRYLLFCEGGLCESTDL